MKERLARASDRLFDRLRARAAFTVTEDTAVDGDLDSVRGSTYALLVTFRRNGDPLPTPVWCAVDDAGIAYVKTARHAGKLKRLRNDDRALLAPATARGKPTGSAIRVRGRALPEAEWTHAEATLANAYGAVRRLSDRALGDDELSAYIELTPRH